MTCLASIKPSCLIAEDEPILQLDLEEHIKAAGYDVISASSAERALKVLNDGSASLAVAIVDIRLRGEACVELARELRARQIPFVVHTGYSPDAELRREFRDVPWITKPSDPSTLLSILEAIRPDSVPSPLLGA